MQPEVTGSTAKKKWGMWQWPCLVCRAQALVPQGHFPHICKYPTTVACISVVTTINVLHPSLGTIKYAAALSTCRIAPWALYDSVYDAKCYIFMNCSGVFEFYIHNTHAFIDCIILFYLILTCFCALLRVLWSGYSNLSTGTTSNWRSVWVVRIPYQIIRRHQLNVAGNRLNVWSFVHFGCW